MIFTPILVPFVCIVLCVAGYATGEHGACICSHGYIITCEIFAKLFYTMVRCKKICKSSKTSSAITTSLSMF